MKKQTVINYLWKWHSSILNLNDMHHILKQYCKDNGREDDSLIEYLISFVSASGILIPLIDWILCKYKAYHNIIEVYKGINDRSILLIY